MMDAGKVVRFHLTWGFVVGLIIGHAVYKIHERYHGSIKTQFGIWRDTKTRPNKLFVEKGHAPSTLMFYFSGDVHKWDSLYCVDASELMDKHHSIMSVSDYKDVTDNETRTTTQFKWGWVCLNVPEADKEGKAAAHIPQ